MAGEIEPTKYQTVEIGQRFPLFDPKSQLYSRRNLPIPEFGVTLHADLVPNLDFVATLGTPFRSGLLPHRDGQLYVVSYLWDWAETGLVTRRTSRMMATGVTGHNPYEYQLHSSISPIIQALRLTVYEPDGGAYRGQPDKNELTDSKVQFGQSFLKFPAEDETGSPTILVYKTDEVDQVEAEFSFENLPTEDQLNPLKPLEPELVELIRKIASGDESVEAQLRQSALNNPTFREILRGN